jgi:endonuclease G
MKKFLFALLLAATSLAQAWDQRAPNPVQACAVHSPYGFAQTVRPVTPICREAYLVAYDAPVKIPAYVAYTLLPQNALGCWPRTNAFVADQSVAGGARPDDYAGTGYDKGHAAPDGDLSWSQQVEYESFLMTNMYPQHGSLNRGIWKLLETSVRGWAVQRNQPYTIYVGALYGAGDPSIGKGVIVPHGFYKIVINNTTHEIAGWGFPHTKPYVNLGNDLTKFRVPVATIMQQAGVTYAFPAGSKEIAPGAEWPVDYGKLTNAKRAKCGANAAE